MKSKHLVCILLALFVVALAEGPPVVMAEEAGGPGQRVTWTVSEGLKFPKVAVSDGVIHLVYFDESDIYYQNSSDNGGTWVNKRQLSIHGTIQSTADFAIAVEGSSVHVVWAENEVREHRKLLYDVAVTEELALGEAAVCYRRSLDRGRTWGPIRKLTLRQGEDRHYREFGSPAIALSGVEIHAAWIGCGTPGESIIYYSRSLNNGQQWDYPRRLVSDPAEEAFARVAIACNENSTHIVWQGRSLKEKIGSIKEYAEISHIRSIDRGRTWPYEQTTIISANDEFDSLNPDIAASYDNVHVVCEDYRHGNPEIYYINSLDNGSNWNNETRITNLPTSQSRFPSVAAWREPGSPSPGEVHVVWQDDRMGPYGIYQPCGIYWKMNNGAGWPESPDGDIRLATGIHPDIAIAPNSWHLIWASERRKNLFLDGTLTEIITSELQYKWRLKVLLPGDVNGDGEVDGLDLALVAAAFNTRGGMPRWNPAADLNGDGLVDIRDLTEVGRNYGSTFTP